MEQSQPQSKSEPQKNGKFWCKVFQSGHNNVVGICDKDLLGKELKDDNSEMKITKYFYGGVLIDEKVAINTMKKATIGNIVGKEIVKLAVENGFITEENLILINGIPHAQFVKL